MEEGCDKVDPAPGHRTVGLTKEPFQVGDRAFFRFFLLHLFPPF